MYRVKQCLAMLYPINRGLLFYGMTILGDLLLPFALIDWEGLLFQIIFFDKLSRRSKSGINDQDTIVSTFLANFYCFVGSGGSCFFSSLMT